jgi:hypothetical protein
VITRWEHEEVLEAMQRRLDENPQAMRQRRETVEHPFGTIKMRMGATHFLMKRLKNVRTEMALSVLAYNLTRVMNIIGIRPLLAPSQAWIAGLAADSQKSHAENRYSRSLQHPETPISGKTENLRHKPEEPDLLRKRRRSRGVSPQPRPASDSRQAGPLQRSSGDGGRDTIGKPWTGEPRSWKLAGRLSGAAPAHYA